MLLLSCPNCHRAISFNVTFWSSSFSSLLMFFGTEQGNSCPFCAGGMENILKTSFYENVFRIFSLLLVGSTLIWIYNVPIIWAVCMKGRGVWRAVWDLQTNEWMNLSWFWGGIHKTTQALAGVCPGMRPERSFHPCPPVLLVEILHLPAHPGPRHQDGSSPGLGQCLGGISC